MTAREAGTSSRAARASWRRRWFRRRARYRTARSPGARRRRVRSRRGVRRARRSARPLRRRRSRSAAAACHPGGGSAADARTEGFRKKRRRRGRADLERPWLVAHAAPWRAHDQYSVPRVGTKPAGSSEARRRGCLRRADVQPRPGRIHQHHARDLLDRRGTEPARDPALRHPAQAQPTAVGVGRQRERVGCARRSPPRRRPNHRRC